MAVVDDELKVHGLDGLRVIDASVMPAVTSTKAARLRNMTLSFGQIKEAAS
jgi:choline dehydrogenase-like flavoprotein